MNGTYLRALPPDEYAHALVAYLREQGYDWPEERIRAAAPLVQEKIERLGQFPEFAGFLFERRNGNDAESMETGVTLDADVLAAAEETLAARRAVHGGGDRAGAARPRGAASARSRVRRSSRSASRSPARRSRPACSRASSCSAATRRSRGSGGPGRLLVSRAARGARPRRARCRPPIAARGSLPRRRGTRPRRARRARVAATARVRPAARRTGSGSGCTPRRIRARRTRKSAPRHSKRSRGRGVLAADLDRLHHLRGRVAGVGQGVAQLLVRVPRTGGRLDAVEQLARPVQAVLERPQRAERVLVEPVARPRRSCRAPAACPTARSRSRPSCPRTPRAALVPVLCRNGSIISWR